MMVAPAATHADLLERCHAVVQTEAPKLRKLIPVYGCRNPAILRRTSNDLPPHVVPVTGKTGFRGVALEFPSQPGGHTTMTKHGSQGDGRSHQFGECFAGVQKTRLQIIYRC